MKQKHIFPKKIDENIAEVSSSNNNYSFRIINHFNNNNNNNKAQTGVRCRFSRVNCSQSSVVGTSVHGDYGSGAAKRRRDSRLRMHWRHEQLALQMALAAALHHSRDVGPRVVQRCAEPEDC